MKKAIENVPLLAIPLVIAEYLHTGTGALDHLFDLHTHPLLSIMASGSFVVALAISGFCVWVYLSRLCLWILRNLERADSALQKFARRATLGLLKRAVAKLEKDRRDKRSGSV